MYFSFLSERSGRRRPPAERSALYINIPTFVFFNYLITRTCLTLSESTTIFCRFYDLCFLRATLFLPGKEKGDFVCSVVSAGSLSLSFTGSLKFILHFRFFLFSFCVRACTRSTALRASPAPSSALDVFMTRRRVCLETRGMPERAPCGLHLFFSY